MKMAITIILSVIGFLCLPLFAEVDDGTWTHSSQLGVALSGGNSDAQTYNAKQETGYRWSGNVVKSTGHYLLGNAAGAKSAENWHLDFRYERELSERFSIYAGPGVEGDKFAGYDTRINLGTGGKYWIIPGDKKLSYVFTEAGYQYQRQNNVAGSNPASMDSHFIRAYLEGSKALTETVSGKIWIEVLPDLSEGRNLLLNFEPSASVVLSTNFSLKLAFTGKYDGLPNAGKQKFDWQYTTSLVATY